MSGEPVVYPLCPTCRGPLMLLDEDTRYAYCVNEACEVNGIHASEVAVEEQQTPSGWPRPVLEDRPVPWVTPVIGDRAAWITGSDARVQRCERERLCQVCGELLGETVWRATGPEGELEGGPLHPRCMELAQVVCPALRGEQGGPFVFDEVRLGDVPPGQP